MMKIFTIIQAILALTITAATAQQTLKTTRSAAPTTSTSHPFKLNVSSNSLSSQSKLEPRSLKTSFKNMARALSGPPQKKPPSAEKVQNTKHSKFCTLSDQGKQLCITLDKHVRSCAPKTDKNTVRPAMCSQKSSEYLLESVIAEDPCKSIDYHDELGLEICNMWFAQSDRCRRHVVTVMKKCSENHLLYLLNGWNEFFKENSSSLAMG
ncbi:hypothetical protein DM02DRAFT_624313 [Periconia macrospinosa]|uniref:Extracellular membrane protein CFEM domain-containing protein n=1 Tax=Periconia macrospinosa TaxID=97972 RepID=A0A2V1E422_9PLEO|nr:hypothetical protein DM02DRAFT_624313 [Periconia macrospinosa]